MDVLGKRMYGYTAIFPHVYSIYIYNYIYNYICIYISHITIQCIFCFWSLSECCYIVPNITISLYHSKILRCRPNRNIYRCRLLSLSVCRSVNQSVGLSVYYLSMIYFSVFSSLV